MGKTGKWIRNFLLGKKEDKLEQIDTFCPENKGASSNKMVVKRRWSLRKLSSGRITGKVAEHNFSRSFDLDDSIKLQIQALLEAHIPRYLPTALAKVYEDTTEFQNTAATKIQSAFRSYLARKALHALRGLVKLQAVVRGYLVRKQTSCTLRGMHALMSIQVRARINRIQMVEAEANANLLTKPLQHTQQIPFFMTQENRSEESIKNRKAEEIVKSKSGGGLEVKSRKYGSMAYNYSKRLSVSKRENNNSGTTATAAYGGDQGNYYCSSRDMNMMINDEESNSKTSMAALSTTTTTNSLELEEVLLPHRQSPNYMNKTKSSKAKTRSRSEPKQRPEKQGSKSWKNINYNIGPNQEEVMLSNSSRFEQYWVRDSSTKRDSIGSSTDVTDSSYYYYY